MKITDVKTFVVGNPPPHFGGRYWIFLKLTTDSGVVGYGEVYSVPFHPHVVAKMIEDVCVRKVIGSDPFKIERLWRNIYGSGYTQRPRHVDPGHSQWHRNGLLGYCGQGTQQAGL